MRLSRPQEQPELPLAAGAEAVAGLAPGRRIGGFVLRRFIAQGGMGQVWEAFDEGLQRAVALKLMLAESVDERGLALFAREARAGGRLAHPGIVTTLAHGSDAGLMWIAQELVEGSWTLKDFLDELRAADQVPEGYYRRAAELAAELADALQAAHEAGVVHRDVKPQNVLITPDDRPKLTDFGLARVAEDQFRSHSGDFAGTFAYMSPEQVAGRREAIDHRTDVFGLGILLYELLALRRPFEGDTAHQIAERILDYDPPEPSRIRSHCPRELSLVCMKALAKSPAQRYATMGELAADLRRHLSNEPIRARPPSAATRALKWARRNPAISSSAAIGALALALLSTLLAANLRTSHQLERTVEELGRTNRALSQQTALAREQAELAEGRTAEVLSLSAQKDLDDLVSETEELWPAVPELVGRYEDWLSRARILVEGRAAHDGPGGGARPSLAEHRAKLEQLLARGVEGSTPALATQEDAWWQLQLAGLVAGIEALHDPERGLAAHSLAEPFGWGIARRLAFARELAERSVEGPLARERWEEASLAIAESALYEGLELEPQLGLLPLGPDPESGLWEFAHLASGEVPVREPVGRLRITESTGIVLVLIPGGRFWMGAERDPASASHDPWAEPDESPVQEVELSPYFLAKHELTQAQWLRIAGRNPSFYQPPGNLAPSLWHPVEQVSWIECASVLRRYALEFPSEAQWERAARGGTRSVWWCGDERECLIGKANLADQSAKSVGAPWPAIHEWPELDDGWPVHAPVHALAPNPFGLHGIVGNLWEYCGDGFDGNAYERERGRDPLVDPALHPSRVIRGGGYSYGATYARSANRNDGTPLDRSSTLGLRPARRIER